LKDVALEAGVSTALAGRVLGDYGYVSVDKRQRVLEAAERLGYQPSTIARGLKTSITRSIGVVVSDITTNLYTHIVRAVDDVASQNGHNIIVCNTDDNPSKEKRKLEELISRGVDGIVISPTKGNRPLLRRMLHSGVRIVQVDRKLPGLDSCAVTVDNRPAAERAVTHLIEHGFRRVAMIRGPAGITSLDDRFSGYKDALSANGLHYDERLVRDGELRTEACYRVTRDLLSMNEPPDGLFITSESGMVFVLRAIHERGLTIGKDIGVVTFDDPSWVSLLSPPMTAVKQPAYSIGAMAGQMLLGQLTSDSEESRFEDILVRVSFLPRGSCAESADEIADKSSR
jgi:DNA-binding LacI/PurR family transcriptional regulator